MEELLKKIEKEFNEEIKKIKSLQDLENIRIKFLGRKSSLSSLFSSLPKLNIEGRKRIGQLSNILKEKITSEINHLKQRFAATPTPAVLFDPTLPLRVIEIGNLHPLTIIINQMSDILDKLGFVCVKGPEIETDYFNFEALNIPKDHPARDLQDTFYIDIVHENYKQNRILLRTHTSPVQIRTMLQYPPPLKIYSPGKVYRRDAIDATHSFMFHQIEGLYVDEDVSFADLKGCITLFFQKLFEDVYSGTIPVRFRPSYFPFTEPSCEVDVGCFICGQNGCKVCKNSGWLEMMGAGMVHPAVFKSVGYESIWRGFAFGLGVERVAMLKFKIEDLRLFYQNALDFLSPK